ncbi:hypothetical protein F53441_7264 [Fusarium austroafricanum]|uniref:Fungal N-terminal domain-containing protein n=1 Tax=Fusarium austroafricanum TaxID=2364996 RepID=A0A8H4KDV9_9HYPO|nr:hypothetical protein F53441_7264 [Fusarium austroafricanum]
MAEVIGLVASIVSLLDVALKSYNALHDLQFQVRNAPYLIQALENETEAIILVLTHVENTIRTTTAARLGSSCSAAILSDLEIELRKSEAVLQQLGSFINSLKNETTCLQRIKWARKKEKATELQKELKEVRIRISELQLAYSNSSLTRIELVLQDIQIMQRRQHAATRSLGACLLDTRDQLTVDQNTVIQSQADIAAALEALQTKPTLPPDWVESISNQLATTMNSFRPHPAKSHLLAGAERHPVLNRIESGVQCLSEAKDDNTALSPHRTHGQESLPVISSPLARSTLVFKLELVQSQCLTNCLCRCHASVSSHRPWNALPKGLQMITGSMLFEYSSSPVSRVTCDLRSCYKTRLTRLTLRYGFPLWSLNYAIHVLVERSSTNNLTFTLALRRRIPWTASRDNILHHTSRRNLSAIKRIVDENPTAVLDVDYNGNSALHISARIFHACELSTQIWRVLLQAGADPDQVNAHGLSFRHYIGHFILHKRIPLKLHSEVERLIQISQCIEDLGLSFIHEVVVKRCPIDLAPVLKAGKSEIIAQINAQDRFGTTPLMYAVVLGNEKASKALIKAGASVHTASPFGHTVLDFAGRLPPNTCATILDILLAAGANASAASHSGWSLLHTAALYDNVTMIDRLIHEGARPDCLGPNGNRPIHYAATRNSDKVVHLLHEKGVDLNVLNYKGLSPLGVAISNNAHDVQSTLLKLGVDHLITGDKGTIFHVAAYWGYERTFKTLSSFNLKGLDVYARDKKGLTGTDVFENRYDKTDQLALAFYQLKASIISQSSEGYKGEGQTEDEDEFFDAYEFL